MNTIAMPGIAASTVRLTKVRAPELLSAYNQYAQQIKVLSLDCFDTLLWRNTAEPKDVFYDLEQRPLFKALNCSALMRIEGEHLAYQINRVKSGVVQANLVDIYRAIFPKIKQEQIDALVAEELAAESDACFAFSPVVELMRVAHAQGKKIIIVSDTYLNEQQLQQLLKSKLPAEIFSMIDKVYCSCDYGTGKSGDLFPRVIQHLSVPANTLLHVGDNPIADFDTPLKVGMHALQLLQQSDSIAELRRMQALAASYIDPAIRNSRPLPNPFRAVIATHLTNDLPQSLIGYASLGPVMFAFANFIRDEIEQMKQSGKQPKILFLMRDGYLPALVFNAIAEEHKSTCVRISRFAALASAFRNQQDVERYLAINIKSLRFKDMCKQLLLPDAVAAILVQRAEQARNPAQEFANMIQAENILQVIFTQSTVYRQRLKKYLEKEINLSPGDTLAFVDLGYTGTTQYKLEPIFKEEMNVEIIGLYLIALRTPHLNSPRRGLLDFTSYDDNALVMLVTYISIIEQICTASEASVVDYDANGNPLFSEVRMSEPQHQKCQAIQSECIRFARDAQQFLQATQMKLSPTMLRDFAALNLGRLIYLPMKTELDYLQTFNSDVSLGTSEVFPLVDLQKGVNSLRKRSWLHANKENAPHLRMNYAAEWRSANLELALTLMAQHRYGFEFALSDLSQRTQQVSILFAFLDNKTSEAIMEARLTHDGYYTLYIPVVKDVRIGVLLGKNYRWVELDSADLIKLSHLYARSETQFTTEASPLLSADQMNDKGGGLFECLTEASLLIFAPPNTLQNENYVLRITLRPIVMRD